jgi:low temperature requirement protein LtrA
MTALSGAIVPTNIMAENVSEIIRRNGGPRLLTLRSDAGERHASWLELFFDLVFVLAVAQVTQILVKNSDLVGFLEFAVLFVPIWWSWVGFTFYADRFESNETAYRLLTFAAMLAVAALSLTLSDAFTVTGDMPLVIAYVLVRAILICLYIRAAVYVPLARDLISRLVAGFGSAVAIFLLSLLVPPPFRYYLWAAAVLLELGTPLLNLRQTRIIPLDYSHIPERFGLFTIIVLGEAVIATATGASAVSWTFMTIAMASVGFAMAACVWWVNFEFVEDDAVRSPSLFPRFVYLYSHYFIVASIVALGVGVEHAIKETSEGHLHLPTLALLGGSIATYLAAVTVVKLAAGVCRLLFVRIVTIALSLLLIFFGLYLPPLVVAMAFLMILISGVWLEGRFGEMRPHQESSPIRACEHSASAVIFRPRSTDGCEECIKNNYKWVHLRLCLECGHVGCCDSSRYKHATKHFHKTDHSIMASLEEGDNWAWCYTDERFVPLPHRLGKAETAKIE